MVTLHVSGRFSVYQHPRAGLIVQTKKGGVNLRPDHPQYEEYVEAIKSAIDTKEADALCRALIN